MKRWLTVSLMLTIALSMYGCGGAPSYESQPPPPPTLHSLPAPRADAGNESYAPIDEDGFLAVSQRPLSTFSIDVDRASYSNVRRFLGDNELPPKDAVRIEELVNYFSYDFPEPRGHHPIEISSEVSDCPWNDRHLLVQIGLQTKRLRGDDLPPAQLVFLIDVSGSMSASNKLPLLKSALFMLVEQLRPEDRVAIVTYSGRAGLALPATPGYRKRTILDAIEQLQAGGSTAGSEGIQLAYQIADENFVENGINRVILATDGDFNVGITDELELKRLINRKRASGIHLSVFGFGTGNLKDSRMETLADHGNGQYAYIDNLLEARKMLVSELGGTLMTVAEDVKLQVEFNPATVESYRLIGYENRRLRDRDFNDDRTDAGDIGAGHSVTALYEIVPTGTTGPGIDPLKYGESHEAAKVPYSNELMTVKCRYKVPSQPNSHRLEYVIHNQAVPLVRSSDNFRLAAAAAEFGLLLRESDYRGEASYAQAYQLASSVTGDDIEGIRGEFARMVRNAGLLHGNLAER